MGFDHHIEVGRKKKQHRLLNKKYYFVTDTNSSSYHYVINMSTNIANHKPALITALCKEIAILKEEVQGQQSSGASKKKIKKMNKTKNKNKVRKTQHGKRSFTKSSLVKSKSVPNSHSPTGDVEGGTSSPRSEQLYRQSDDGKSIINVNIFRNELIKIRQVSSF